ncbi:CYN38 [Auxenochlorella protothecoides x Auxenochlorella symbiontica]
MQPQSLRGPGQAAPTHTASIRPRTVQALRTHVQCGASKQTQNVPQSNGAAQKMVSALAAAALAMLAADSSRLVLAPPPATAGLISTDPVKDAKALLRYALPIHNTPIRQVQESLESISEALRIPGGKAFGPIGRAVRNAASILDRETGTITKALVKERQKQGQDDLVLLKQKLSELQAVLGNKDKNDIPVLQQECLNLVGDIEESMVSGYPFEVPKEYANLPQLKGRATLQMDVKFSSPREDNSTGGRMVIVVDGFNAPLSAGTFVDLAHKGFYDGMLIQRSDGFVVQSGKPESGEGYVENGQLRTVPFEVMVQGDKIPVYEETLEDNGRFNEQPVLPFNAFGTLALARAEFDTNSASSQFFFLLKESELTPTGSNLLDGRYAVFGYVTEGAPLLKELQVGDKIERIKVLDGLSNLQAPKAPVDA